MVWKVGSLQAFVDTSESSDNFGCQVYSTSDVQRIGILDVRIANFDRNYGNMLVKVGCAPDGSRNLKLVPIDHGCSLPDRLEMVAADIVWMSWPQSKQPFGEEELQYIANLDGAADARLLNQSLGLERDGLRLLEVATQWLQIAAARGLTLYEIGLALCRDGESLSAVETAVASAISTACMAASTPLWRASTAPNEPCQVAGGAGVGIFDLRRAESELELEWTARMEDLFRRHVGDVLERLACSRTPAVPSAAPAVEARSAVEESQLHGRSGSSEEVPPEPIVLPKRSSKAYVPPHLRRQLQAEHASD